MAFRVYQNTIAPQSLLSPVSLGSLCRLLGQAPDLCLPIKEQHPWASVISSGMAMCEKESWLLQLKKKKKDGYLSDKIGKMA